MKVSPIGNPPVADLMVLIIETELAAFRKSLYQNSHYPRGLKDAERFLFTQKSTITSWRDQLNFLLTYINQDLEPKFRRKPL